MDERLKAENKQLKLRLQLREEEITKLLHVIEKMRDKIQNLEARLRDKDNR